VAVAQALLQMPPEMLRKPRLEKGGVLEMGLTAATSPPSAHPN